MRPALITALPVEQLDHLIDTGMTFYDNLSIDQCNGTVCRFCDRLAIDTMGGYNCLRPPLVCVMCIITRQRLAVLQAKKSRSLHCFTAVHIVLCRTTATSRMMACGGALSTEICIGIGRVTDRRKKNSLGHSARNICCLYGAPRERGTCPVCQLQRRARTVCQAGRRTVSVLRLRSCFSPVEKIEQNENLLSTFFATASQSEQPDTTKR